MNKGFFTNRYFKTLLTIIQMSSCITGGTHGSISGYQYPVSKYSLEKAVLKVITKNLNMQRDTTKAWNDNSKNDYYNDGVNYITFSISKGQLKNYYTFRFAGDSTYWDTSKVSQIFIAYSLDKDGNGGSEGNGGVTSNKLSLKNKLVGLFEQEFIEKIDRELGTTHRKTK